MFHLELTWNRLNYAWERTPFLAWLTRCDLVSYPCLLIAGGKIQQQSEISKQVRKLPAISSKAFDLIVGMIMCRRIPGPPSVPMNIEKLGVAWG